MDKKGGDPELCDKGAESSVGLAPHRRPALDPDEDGPVRIGIEG